MSQRQDMKTDVIVIGGGLGGLMAGITAAKRGKKTLLLEKHTTVGGLAAGFTRKGYYFDAGMSRLHGRQHQEILERDRNPRTSRPEAPSRDLEHRGPVD